MGESIGKRLEEAERRAGRIGGADVPRWIAARTRADVPAALAEWRRLAALAPAGAHVPTFPKFYVGVSPDDL